MGEAAPGNVVCGYHNLQGDAQRMTQEESANAGSWTGFTPPSPVQKYQLGDGLGDICQAWGAQWGYQTNGCPNAWCGMGQLVTLNPEPKPWSSGYGNPKVVVSGWIDANRAQSTGPASGWGYICPYFVGPYNVVLEYCIKAFTLELNGGGNYWTRGTVVCGVGGENIANVIEEFNGTGAFATNLGPGVTKGWSGSSTGWVNFNASISGGQLEAVIKTILGERGVGQACANWPNLSTNPAEYTLRGITVGYEFHGTAVVGVTTNNLKISTEYTQLPPSVTTETATGVGQRRATLNGTLNPNGSDTHYFFQYGETTSYGSTTPEGDAGSGNANVHESAALVGLNPGTTLHYRLVAKNATGTLIYGGDQVFTTDREPNVPFVDAGLKNEMADWHWSDESGWSLNRLAGDEVTAKSSPSVVQSGSSTSIFFADASTSNEIADWFWTPANGWLLAHFGQDAVEAGTSPCAVIFNGYPHVLFVDATAGSTIADWNWTGTAWQLSHFYSDKVAAGTSPNAVVNNGTLNVLFDDASKSNTMADWLWSSTEIKLDNFYGDAIASGSSPSAVVNNGVLDAFFDDASKSNTMADWVWSATELKLTNFYSDTVAANTSPSAIVRSGVPWAFFTDASVSNELSYWLWSPSELTLNRLAGDPVASGTSPSAAG